MYDVIIVGGGPAGFTAALYSARANLKTAMIEKQVTGGQMAISIEMENYPGFEKPISGFELAQKMEKQVLRFGAELIYSDVIKMNLTGKVKEIITKTKTYKAKTVILCMGASPRHLNLESERKLAGSGVSYCATCDGALYNGKNTAVVGGGNTAVEDALYLSRFSPVVYLIHRRDELRADKILQKEILETENIEILWDSVIEDIIGKFGVDGVLLKNVKTNETKQIDCEGLFVAIGRIPKTDLVKEVIETDESGYIISDEDMRTNIPGVFAAGDLRKKTLRQVITAAADGAVASYVAERYIGENKSLWKE
jgi:thioredoxin reductase (NADPH)